MERHIFNYLKISSISWQCFKKCKDIFNSLKKPSNNWRYLSIIWRYLQMLNICWNGVPYITHLILSNPIRCPSRMWRILVEYVFNSVVRCVPGLCRVHQTHRPYTPSTHNYAIYCSRENTYNRCLHTLNISDSCILYMDIPMDVKKWTLRFINFKISV